MKKAVHRKTNSYILEANVLTKLDKQTFNESQNVIYQENHKNKIN